MPRQVEDLGNLIKLYTDWHSRLIPYYSFEQFVRKLEKVGATNRVRVSAPSMITNKMKEPQFTMHGINLETLYEMLCFI